MALSLDEALGMSLADETDESIHVDIDTRQVTIPESQHVFGVESDEDVEVKHIIIDGRYNDGTDLSTFTFRVNYQNANGDKGTYLATKLKVNDSSIEFDWIIGRQVVAYKGTIAFIVCAYTIDSSSVIQNEWNSTLGKGTVLEGLEVSEFDFGDDIVRQLASILSDVNAAQASAKASADEAYKSKTEVVALGKEQQAAIEKKGKDTLATIPEDYTQVSNDVSQLKEATSALKDGKISKFYASSQGNTNLQDSDDGRIVDLKLYGKSEQKQYSGKNLLNLRNGLGGTGDGVTYTRNDDGSYARKGTATATTGNIWFAGGYGDLSVMSTLFTLKAGTYTVKDCVLFSGGTGYYDTFTTAADLPITGVRNLWQDIGTTYNDTIYPRALAGDTDTGWEPYVGGIPSPNPEYPQEIKSVVKPVVKVMGKNLLKTINWETQTVSGVTIEKTSDTVFKISGTATGEVSLDSYWGQGIKVPAQSYLLCKILHGSCPAGSMVYFFSAGYDAIASEIGGISPLRTSEISCGLVRFAIKKGSNINCTVGLSIQMDTSTDYEPYTETSAKLPYTLNAIPVSSGGNVTIDGQQYIADYVDVEKGKLVRMCKEVDFEKVTPSSEINVLTNSREVRFSALEIGIKQLPSETPNNEAGFITSIRRLTPGTSTWNIDEVGVWQCGQGSDTSNLTMRVPPEAVIGYIEYIKSIGGCKGVFQAATPTETDLTADEIAGFKALVSHYPVTNVSTTSDQLDGYTVFDYPISLANGWNYVKQQLGDTRDYLYGIDLMTAEAYVNSEYAAALAEIEV